MSNFVSFYFLEEETVPNVYSKRKTAASASNLNPRKSLILSTMFGNLCVVIRINVKEGENGSKFGFE